jgi:hypothetical protein
MTLTKPKHLNGLYIVRTSNHETRRINLLSEEIFDIDWLQLTTTVGGTFYLPTEMVLTDPQEKFTITQGRYWSTDFYIRTIDGKTYIYTRDELIAKHPELSAPWSYVNNDISPETKKCQDTWNKYDSLVFAEAYTLQYLVIFNFVT